MADKKIMYDGFYVRKNVNDELYNMVINDCEFERDLVDNKNIAKFTFNK